MGVPDFLGCKIPCDAGSSEVSPICADYIIDATDTHEGQETLFCDGTCQCWFHHWCPGVSQARYKLISASPEPFLCSTCTFDRQQAVIQDLQSNVQALTEEKLQGLNGNATEGSQLYYYRLWSRGRKRGQ